MTLLLSKISHKTVFPRLDVVTLFRLCTFKGLRGGGSTACVFHATWHLTLINFFVIQFHFFLLVNFRTMPFKLLQESCLEILDRP